MLVLLPAAWRCEARGSEALPSRNSLTLMQRREAGAAPVGDKQGISTCGSAGEYIFYNIGVVLSIEMMSRVVFRGKMSGSASKIGKNELTNLRLAGHGSGGRRRRLCRPGG